MGPTLSGAESGNCRPLCDVHFWVYKTKEADDLERVSARMRILTPRTQMLATKIAAQFCEHTRRPDQRMFAERLLQIHAALCTKESLPKSITPLWGALGDLLDDKGNAKIDAVANLRIWDLADGQFLALEARYSLLLATETPDDITQEQWEALITEGKSSSLSTLIAKYGSSTVTAVVHGTPASRWQG